MDQPQNDDDQVRNDEAVDTGTTQDSVDETSTDGQYEQQSQSIPVTVVNNASDESPSSEETPIVDEAEAAVEEASPMAATDELASVASELSAMPAESESTEPQVDEGVPSGATEEEHSTGLPVFSPGSDPMDQVNADVEQTEGVQTPDGPAPQPEVMSEPPVEEDAPSMEQSSESTDSVAPEPPEDVIGQEPVVEDAPESHEAVSMANDAVLEQEPTPDPGEHISDVVTPTAVAAAIAEGTSGANAISGTPESSSSGSSLPTSTPSTQAPAKPKSKKNLLIMIVVLVTLLFGGAAVAAYLMSQKSTDKKSSTSTKTTTDAAKIDTSVKDGATPVQTTPAPGETVAAKVLDDYKVACGGGTVTNATDYKGVGPHPLVFFEKGSDEKYAMSVVALKDKTWAADATKITSGQLAVCVAQKVGSEKKLKACPITDPATKVTSNVDFYSATYTVDVYNAKTGVKVSTNDSPSIATECPTTATYSKSDPKIFVKYDLPSVETLIKDAVTKTVQ